MVSRFSCLLHSQKWTNIRKEFWFLWVMIDGSDVAVKKEIKFVDLYAYESEARKKFKELMKEYLNELKEKYEIE